MKKIIKNINAAYDTKNDLIFDQKLVDLEKERKEENNRKFEESKMKPLMLLNSNQLTQVIFFHRRRMSNIRKKIHDRDRVQRKKSRKIKPGLKDLFMKKPKQAKKIDNFFMTSTNQYFFLF